MCTAGSTLQKSHTTSSILHSEAIMYQQALSFWHLSCITIEEFKQACCTGSYKLLTSPSNAQL